MKSKILKFLTLAAALCGATAWGTTVAKVGETEYETLEAAIAAAEPVGGVVTYEICGKAEVSATGWIQVLKSGLSNVKKVAFVGTTEDAEISIAGDLAILADEHYDIDVSFSNLKLSKPNPQWANDYGHSTNYFTTWLRNTGAAENTVTYENCMFPNGARNNQYGKTVYKNCTFANVTTGLYNLWIYGGSVEVDGGVFTGTRGMKVYTEKTPATAPSVEVKGTAFSGLTEKAAIVVSKAATVKVAEVSVANCQKGLFQKDIEGSTDDQKVTVTANGSNISGSFAITAAKEPETAKTEFNITGGTFTDAVPSDYCADGFTVKATTDADGNTVYGVVEEKVVDFAAFVDALKAANYTFDGSTHALAQGGKLTVKWSPVSGCYDTQEGHECTVGNVAATVNTPKRVNSDLAQFQLFEGASHAVSVKNVAFVYEPAAFTICANSGWKGSYTADKVRAGQIYLMNTGDVTFEGCSFDKVVLTSFNCTGTSTVKDCSFNNVYNSYAVKDIRGANVAVTGCTFENCGAAVMVSSTVKVDAVTIRGNTFKNVDVAGTAPEGKVGTRGLVQIASSGDYADTAFDFSGNTATGCGPVLRQLNSTVSFDADDKTNLGNLVSDGGASAFYTDDSFVAQVGDTKYATLAEAFAALSAQNHTLTLLKDAAWDAATPVYWAAGTQSGYAATLTAALTAAYKADAGAITIVCRPGADVGTMTHGHVADDLTIYGNNAYLSDGECDLEVDTYAFSRTTGAQAADGVCLDKDITITAYELDNLGVWGQRNTDHTVTINLTDCDGKALEGKTNVQRVYISGTTGVNNITLTGCDFITKATAVYSNVDGAITAVNCSFTGGQVPFNINHKANGAQTVAVENCTFTNCGDADGWKQFAAPLRLVNSGTGTLSAVVTGCTFAGTVGANGDILLGDGRKDQASNDVALKVVNTAANIQAQKPGYYVGETVDTTKMATAESLAAGTLETSIAQLLPVVVVVTDTASAQAALDAATPNTTIIFKSGTYEPLFIRQTLAMSTRRSDLDMDGSYPAYLRSFKNLTLVAAKGAEVVSQGITAEAGLFWHATAPASNQAEMNRATSGFISYLSLENVTIDGIAFDSSERSAVTLRDNGAVATRGNIMVDGLTIQNCTGRGVASNKNIHFLAAGAGTNDQNFPGTEKKAFNNLVVKKCELDSYYQPIAFNNATAVLNGLTVTGNTFSNNGNSNVLQLSNKVNSGAFVIENNLFKDLNGRVVRATTSTANWTITGNRLDKPIMYDDSGELDLVKINVMAETVGTAVTESDNDWNPGTLANGTYIADGDPTLLPVAKIGDTYYWTLKAAVEAAKIGDTITIIANDASLSAPEGWTISGSTLIPVDKTWHIANLDQLKEFQSAVNGGNSFDGQTVVLDADINMASEENWTPVGNTSEKKFAGTFDGQNHTISGLKITGGSYVGLFGYLGAATVQNVALVGANVSGVKRVGALVGQIAGNATIKNCSLDATSSVTGSDSNTGGLIGEASGSIVVTLENLTNNAPVTNTESGTSRAAGILCQATSGASVTLKNCVNNGTITTNGGYAGGIVSAKQGGASLVFDGCSNTGTLANGTKGTGALLAWSCNGSSVTISNYSGDVANAIGWLSQDNYDHVFVINGVEHYIRVAKGGSGYTFASRYEAARLMDESYLQEIIGFFNYAKTVNANFEGYPATPVEVLKSAYNTRDESIKGGLFNTDVASGWPQLLRQYNTTSGKSLTAGDFTVKWGTRDVLFKIGDAVAKIGNSYYATLAAALIGAKSGDTIQILAGTWGEDAIGKLDEEGKYTNANIVRYKSLTIQPAEGAEVKFTSTLSLGYDDSSTANATMTVKNLNFDGASLKLSNYVQATVEGCTFKNGTSSTSGTLIVQDACCINHKTADTYPTSQVTIKNCTIDGSNDGASAIRIRNSGNVTITGNTIKNSKFNGILMESNNSVDNSVAKSIVITGNTITEWNAANVAEGGRAMRLALGTLAAESTVFVANNVFRKATTGLDSPDFAKITGVGAATVSLDGNDWNDELRSTVSGNTAYYTVDTTSPVLLAGVVTTKHEPVAQVTVNGVTTKYTTFEDALAAANAATDATITLLDDVAYATNGSGLWNITSSMTLDGGGHALNGYGTRSGNKTTLAINNGGSAMVAVTLKNLTIRNEGPAGRPIETRGNISSLTLENCEVTATGSGNNQGITIGGNQSSAAKVVLKNTTVDAGRSGYPYISFNPAAVEISGGTLSGYCGMYFKGVNESTGSQGTVVTATGTKFDCPNVHEEGLNDFGVFVLEDDGITIKLTDCRVNSAVQGTARQAVVMTKDNAQRRTQPCSISIAGSETHVNGELMDNVWDKGPVVSVSGGTFTHAIDETYCAAGFIPTANADGTYGVKEGSYVAQIGETKYETLAEAVQAAKSGDTVVLLKNCAGDGVVVSADKNITIDFAGYTYTVDGATVGSAGTETSGFQLLKGATVTLKGGTLTSTKAKILIQNYANLTLLDMTVTGGTATQYVVSNNCGAMNVLGGTSITATTGNRAFDVCATQHYPDGVTVKIDTTGTITGIIEYDVWGSKPAENKATLEIVNGTFVGTWNVESALAEDAKTNLNVSGGTFSVAVPEDYCAEGYIPTANADGTYGVKEGSYVAQIGETKYETLAEAVQAAKSGDTVVLLKNCAGDGIKIPSGSNLTVDFRGFTYTVDGTTVGSAGTETQAFQLLQDSTITFRNGTIKSTTAQMLIQNYANLTLDQMVLDGSKLIGSKPYTLSTNNGVTKIKDSTITAAEGGIAFDACCWEPYTSNSVELLGASVVNGDIEVSSYHDRIPTLTLTAGTVNGNLVMSDGADKAVVSKADAVTLAAPADYKWNDEGLLVPKVYVAQVGETKYETLQEAVGAAAAGATITMIADEDVKQTIYVNKQVTIDLNGKKLSNSEDIWDSSVADWSLISVRSGANLTITGNGTLDAKENDCYAIDVRDYDAKVTVLNGTFVGNVSAVYVWGGELNIQGGSFDIKQLNDSDKPYRFLINCLDGNFKNGSAKVSISGGTFKGFNPKDNVAEGTGTDFCAPDYTGVEIETGVWTVIEEQSNTLTAVVDSQMSLVVVVPESVLYGKYEELDGETVTDKKNAYINEVEANGLKVWQNYVMGVNGSVEGNKLLTDYEVGGGAGDGEWITVKTPIASFNPPTDSGITVKYRLLCTATPGNAKSWEAVGELKDTPSFPVNIAGQEGDTFWKIEVVFQGEAANE